MQTDSPWSSDHRTRADVVRIPLGFVSAFLVRGAKTIIVDTGTSSSSRRIMKALEANGISARDVSLILLTHAHGDHSGSAAALKEITGAPIAMHRNCARDLRQGKRPVAPARTCIAWILENIFGLLMKNPVVGADVEFDEELDLSPYGVAGRAVHTPGHTDGCASLLLDGGQAVVGDLLAGASDGRCAKLPMFLRDLEILKRSLGLVAAAAPLSIHNAHGPACTAEACRKLLETCR